jgi:hypothetical protein
MIRNPHASFQRKLFVFPILSLLLMAASPTVTASDLVITGVVDGPLSGGIPKAIEVCVLNDIRRHVSVRGV